MSTTIVDSMTQSPPTATPPALLELTDVTVDVSTSSGITRIVDGVTLRLAAGERLALVGESGSGKSATAQAIMRLNPSATVGGRVEFDGTDLLTLPERRMRVLRGSSIGMVFQDPLRALSPVHTIGVQVTEPLRIRGVGRKEARRKAIATLDRLGVADAARRMRAYPHEFSGGMRQRVVLAIALIGDPQLLIADEPTTALDVRVQEKVLALIDEVAAERSLAVLMITHNLGMVADFADRVAVMYGGRVVESDDVLPLYDSPAHPYTRALLDAVPRLDRVAQELRPIPGVPATPANRPAGCAFHPRCARAGEVCGVTVPLSVAKRPGAPSGGTFACHNPLEVS
jgi:peptide/nickel transport system ATP-binding protein